MAKFLSVTETAKRKGMSRQGVHLAIRRGDLPADRVGHHFIIREEDCESWQPLHLRDERRRKNGTNGTVESADAPRNGLEDFLAFVKEIAENAPPEDLTRMPADGAENHDHYLYGAKKH
jgi:hypothetical protein